MAVTLQDLAQLEQLERMRAEFPGMVSHQLRAPLTLVKGSPATVLSASRVLGPAEIRQFFRIIDEQANHMNGLIGFAHLFRKYAGAEDAGRGVGGGLAICKGLVEAHGGRIRAETGGVGQGTRFTFTIPVAEEAGAVAPGWTPATREGAEPARILVVDDDPQTLRYVRDTLTEAGYAALATGDHRELAHIIRREKPRLVLLDMILSGTDGIELMERVPALRCRGICAGRFEVRL